MINERYQEDLTYFFQELETYHLSPYLTTSKESITNYIQNYLNSNTINNDFDFAYFLQIIIKKLSGIYDSHTKVNFKNNSLLPIMFEFYENSFYVVRTTEPYRHLLYSKIIAINHIPIQKLINECEQSISYSTNNWFHAQVEYMLSHSMNLRSLPSLPTDAKELTFTLEKDGMSTDININLEQKYKYNLPSKNYTYQIYGNSLVAVYNQCYEQEEGQMENFLKQLDIAIKTNPIDTFILDLRDNSGGNNMIIRPLIAYLQESHLQLITLVNRYNFSGGRFAINDMQNIGSIFIGEEIGTVMNCFGNIHNFTLPNTKLKMTCSSKFFYLDEKNVLNAVITKEEFQQLDKSVLIPKYFQPDITVTPTIYDIKNQKDPILEKALSYNLSTKQK